MTTFGKWLSESTTKDDRPERPSTAGLDVEERTELQAEPDYATEHYEPPEYGNDYDEPEPLPVYMVQAPPPLEQDYNWAGATHTVDSQPTQLAGRDRRRKRMVVRNLDDTENVLLGPGPLMQGFLSFQVPPGASVEFTHNDAIWAMASAEIEVSTMNEYALDEQW